MRKNMVYIILLCFMMLVVSANANNAICADIANYIIKLNGEEVKFYSPLISVEGRIYVPLREFVDMTGAAINWDKENETVNIYVYDGTERLPNNFKSDNWTTFSVKDEDGVLYGYKDELGNVVIEPIFQYAKDFSEGLAVVSTDKNGPPKYGVIDEAGKFVIEEKYSYLSGYSLGVCAASGTTHSHSIYIDRYGRNAFGTKTFISAYPFSDEYAVVQTSGINYASQMDIQAKYSYIGITGELATDKEWDYASNFKNGIAIVELDGVRMRIDKNFEVVEYID